MITKSQEIFFQKNLTRAIRIVTTMSVAVAATGWVAASWAQGEENLNAGTSEVTQDLLEEVLVTGQRGSIESAQAIKRDSEVFVDAVTAVDIGALPDRSVAEALQRIPGVQLQRTNDNRDPARLAAEGGDVFVRGLSWVRTELNGRDIFSADSGRSLGFEDVSADLMAGVDVYKSPSADMIEGGIGGVVNLRTRLPFDSDGMILAGAVDYNYAELYEEGFPSANGLFSNRWETGLGEIGFLFSASVSEIGNRTDSMQTGRYVAYDAEGLPTLENQTQAEYYLPTGLGFRRIDWEQERNALAAAFQWAPNDDLTVTLQALRAEANPTDIERNVGIYPPWQANMDPTHGEFDYDEQGFLIGGTLTNAAIDYNTRIGARQSTTSDYSINFQYEVSSNLSVSGDLQRVASSGDVESMTIFTQLSGPNDGFSEHSGVRADFRLGNDPMFDIGGDQRQLDQSEFWWGAAMDHIEDNDADSFAGRLDLDYEFDGGFINSVSSGARRSERDTTTRQSGWNWSLLSNQFWGGAASPEDIAYLDDYASDQTELYQFENFFRGDRNAPAVGWFATEQLVADRQRAYEQLSPTQSAGWGWAPLEAPEAYDLDPRADNVSAGINDQTEVTNAVYVMSRFGEDGEWFGVPFDGNIGLRVVETETTARGRSGAGGVSEECDASDSEACVGARAFVEAFNAEMSDIRDYNNSYTNVLPSFNVRFMLTDEVQLRLAAARTMVRPAFHQTRPYTNLSFDFVGDQFDAELPAEGSGTGGSPDLRPAKSDQLDVSAEWYFDDSGSVTLALFRKELSDYAAAITEDETYTYGGRTYDFAVTRHVNADDGTLQGFEIAYQQFYDMLPSPFDGFGIQSNFTYIDNEGGSNTAYNVFDEAQVDGAVNEGLPMEGMSRTSYNIALMYEKDKVSARLAYNWRERYLLTTSAANINRPVWFNDYGQLDGSFFYTINDHLKTGIQVTNLLAEDTTLEVGDTTLAGDYSWTAGDRRVALVLRGQY